jgi:hypothetical protein
MIKPTRPTPSKALSKDEIIEQKMRLLANFMIDRILENTDNKVSKNVPKNVMIKVNPSSNDGTRI